SHLSQPAQDIKAAIDRHKTDQRWVPAYEGGNADHDCVNGLVSLMAPHWKLPVLEFAEYNFCGGKANAQTFPAANGTETTLLLTPDEQTEKKALLKIYVSEQKNLGYIGTTQESYRPLAAYDYSKPPHEGTLWYTRFHWVPFGHPRIDFTRPQEVCAALASWPEATSGSPEFATPEDRAHTE
ncbi:MAG: hypothetical protein PHW63_08505, partial [Alphaproteobacteria bacterium]|nr:hypothetical protein [Alphaproteobacteria bacterium]